MPHNLQELRMLLDAASSEHREALAEIIKVPFGNSPDQLCDHLSFLRGGALGQFFCSDYKQLVTDVADRVRINWTVVAPTPQLWKALTAEQIEDAIVAHIDHSQLQNEDTMPHVPAPIQDVLRTLAQYLASPVPLGPWLVDMGLGTVFSFLATDWTKLLATVVYTNQGIRGKLRPNAAES